MRRAVGHIRNFYEDADDDAGGYQPERQPISAPTSVPFSVVSSSTLPGTAAQPHHFVGDSRLGIARRQDSGGREGLPIRSNSRSSSASIEGVIPCEGTSFSPHTGSDSAHNLFAGGGPVSLRDLRESVEEAVRDVRRLDALMRKAVWHAVTHHSCSRDGKHHTGASTVPVPKVSPGAQRCASSSASPGTAQELAVQQAPAVRLHEKPFLPPDRYPSTPALQETSDHFTRNLSGALFAAHRAGLLKRHHIWMQRHFSTKAKEDVLGVALSPSSSASTRRKALQRISTLTTSLTAASQVGRGAVSAGEGRARAPTTGPLDSAENRVRSSVSMIILCVAKSRAIATVFLRQLRLAVYTRRALRESVELRFSYYLQRRSLRRWCSIAATQRHWRISLLRGIVFHWQRFVHKRKILCGVLSHWRGLLHQRNRAFSVCQRAQRRRYFEHWVRVFTWHRERSALNETATAFSEHWQRRRRSGQKFLEGYEERRELLALLEGKPHSFGSGTALVTAVGPRLLLRRLFLSWKQRTELRLMAHLAVWHYAQQMRANVVRRIGSCARRLALKHRRNQPEHQRRCSVHPGPSANGGDSGVENRSRAPRHVHVGVIPDGLLKYKTTAAQSIASASQLRRCFDRWRVRFQAWQADRFHLQSVYAHAVCRWLQALSVHRAQRLYKQLVFSQWVAATEHRHAFASASQLHVCQLLRHAHKLWRHRLAVRLTHKARLLQGCFQRWRDRVLKRRVGRAIQCTRQRFMLRHWHQRAQARLQSRTNLYVADTINETTLILGCFRHWRFRAAERRRAQFAWDVLGQLRRERLSRRCFDRWRGRAFGPLLPRAKRLTKDISSPITSLLV